MNTEDYSVPPEHVWIPVWDMTSAIQGLNVLLEYILHYDETIQYYQDNDSV